MKRQLTPTQSRLVAVSLAIGAMAFIVAIFALPTWWLHRHYDSYLEDYSDRLQRYLRVAALRPSLQAAIADVGRQDSRQYYLKGASQTLAAAELQSLATRIVETHKGRVISSQVIPTPEEAKPAGTPSKVTITVQMAASIIPLQLILHAIEINEPCLFVDRLSITSNAGRGYKPMPGANPEFIVSITVSGFTPSPGEKS